MNAAIVVIPTTGAPELEQAIQSVLEQTVPCDVLVIFDGSAYARPLALPPAANVFVMTLPFNTGKARTGLLQEGLPRHWYGARVQTAAAYIVNNDYVMILDQDNWLQPNHVESCMAKLDSRPAEPYHFVYALRNIYRKDGSFVCRDDCESLGKHPGVTGTLIDTSCFFYRTDFLMETGHFWLWGWGSDRVYLHRVMEACGDGVFDGTGRYTVNYRLGGNDGSARDELFIEGNATAYALQGAPALMPWAVE